MSQATTRIGKRADIAQSTASFWANAALQQVKQDVNDALNEHIAVSSTTSGENRIDLPSDLQEPINLSLTWSWSTSSSAISSHRTLSILNYSDIDAVGVYPIGTPAGAAFFSTWLELYPSPDSAYSLQLRYRSGGTDLTATTDVPSLSSQWRYGWLLKTEKLLYELLNDWQSAAAKEGQYINYMMKTKSDDARRASGQWGGRVNLIYTTPFRT